MSADRLSHAIEFFRACPTSSIRVMHEAVRHAQSSDPDNVAQEVQSFQDWATAAETVLSARGEKFDPITL